MAEKECKNCKAMRKEIAFLERIVVDPQENRADRMILMLKKLMTMVEKSYDRKMTEKDWPTLTRVAGNLTDLIRELGNEVK